MGVLGGYFCFLSSVCDAVGAAQSYSGPSGRPLRTRAAGRALFYGLWTSGTEILYTLLEAFQVGMIEYNKYTHFICLKSVNCGPIDKEAK